MLWSFSSFAQNTEKKQENKLLEFPFGKPKIDSLKVDPLKFELKKAIKEPGDSSIEMPNAYKNQRFNINPADDSIILQKKIDGQESVLMPGTEKLEPFGRNVKIDTLKSNGDRILKKKKD